MASRDNRGRYINDSDVTIKITEFDGGIKIDFFDKNPEEKDHKSIHTKIYDDGSYHIIDNVNGKLEEVDRKCYLTTACLMHYNKYFDNNCEELTILRWFRDKFVSADDISYYYEIAPIIVEGINNNQKSSLIYEFIYHNIVCTCVNAIKNGNYEFAYQRYKNSVLALEEQFVKKTGSKVLKYS